MLVRLLINHLQENGRIVVVSSDTHDFSKKTGMPAPRYASPAILADPVESDRLLGNLSDLAKGQVRYTTSKLCNLYFAYELSRQIQQSKRSISVAAFNPGMMPGKGSALTRDYRPLLRFIWNNIMPLLRFVRSSVRTNNPEMILQTLFLGVLYRVEHIGTDLKRQHRPRNRTIRSMHLSFGSGVLKSLTLKYRSKSG
jgi:NAD(P)-dependent dehydrogenase (short-subunit alcohol dehydrogenase family)